MKPRWLIFLGCWLCCMPYASALTVDDLHQADHLLREMSLTIEKLRTYVQIAEEGKARGIILTAAQVQTLKTQYQTELSELSTLYQQLPK